MTTICHSTVVTPYWVNFATWLAQVELIALIGTFLIKRGFEFFHNFIKTIEI